MAPVIINRIDERIDNIAVQYPICNLCNTNKEAIMILQSIMLESDI